MEQTTTTTATPKRRFARTPAQPTTAAQPKTGGSRKGKANPAVNPDKAPRVTKADAVFALLSRSEGATIAQMCEATGWQQHSVRGFLAGTVKKKASATLSSDKADGVRTYRLTSAESAPA